MPRTARLSYAGGVFHVICRFHEQRFFIEGPADREKYLRLLGQSLTGLDCQILGYCLMSSHVHLVVLAGQQPLSRLMKPLNTGFAMWKNRGLRRTGPVFAGRYKTVLVDRDEYLLELVAYVHNNPVRAGVVSRAQESDWSSHRAYIGPVEAPRWLNTGFCLGLLNARVDAAVELLGQYVDERRGDARRPEWSGQCQTSASRAAIRAVGDAWRLSDAILGDAAFVAKVQRDLVAADKAYAASAHQLEEVRSHHHLAPQSSKRPRFEEAVSAVCEQLGMSRFEFDTRPKSTDGLLARRVLVLLWIARNGGSQVEVARGLKTHSSKVSRWMKSALSVHDELEPLVDKVERALAQQRVQIEGWSEGRVRYSLEISDEAN
jgi:REP element-mobilizing transposase RayT